MITIDKTGMSYRGTGDELCTELMLVSHEIRTRVINDMFDPDEHSEVSANELAKMKMQLIENIRNAMLSVFTLDYNKEPLFESDEEKEESQRLNEVVAMMRESFGMMQEEDEEEE